MPQGGSTAADLLQTVPEDTAIDFDTGSAKTTGGNRVSHGGACVRHRGSVVCAIDCCGDPDGCCCSRQEPVRIPTAEPDDDEQNAFLVTKDAFLVTKDLRLLRDATLQRDLPAAPMTSTPVRRPVSPQVFCRVSQIGFL